MVFLLNLGGATMTLQDIINLIQKDGMSWLIILGIITSIIEITPIKVNPISTVMAWIGKAFNKETIKKLEKVEKKLDEFENKLNDHITESEKRDVRLRREKILDFANTCINKIGHTQEEFEFIISECDKYETYCEENNIPNGVAKDAISEIHRIYTKCMQENSFLTGGK